MATKIDDLEVETSLVAPEATPSVAGLLSSTDKTKLNGVQTGATANSTDAQLRDRATHTGTQLASTISNFNAASSAAAPVQSVSGKTGVVTLDKTDVGLGNIDNVSDVNKPISNATQTALNLKYDASNPNGYQTSAQQTSAINAAINSLVNGAPGALDQLNELAAAIGNDPNFATTLTNSLALKAPLASPTFTGTVSGITKSMVGLGNIDNTSDANKPVSTAQQTALNLKYDASNPNGYETPAQLATRDTNNRARANHTGTQLASTISDFAATVRSTVLTGISFATSTAVIAADSILVAMGKLQAQVTLSFARANHTGTQLASTISDFAATVRSTVLTGLSLATSTAVTAADSVLVAIGKLQAQLNLMVFGTQYQYFEDLTPFATNSASLVSAALFSASFVNSHQYRLNMQWNFTTTSQTNSAAFQIFVNGVAQGSSILVELKDPTDDITYSTFVRYTSAATSNLNVELRCSMENGSTVTVNTVRFDMWRVL